MSRIVDQPERYFSQLVRRNDPLLRELEQDAHAEGIPIVGPLVGELLFIISVAMRAQTILELGTATGYSAIYLARACAITAGRLTTLEIDPAFAARARKNLERAGLLPHATVICGEALPRMSEMKGPFDLIFMDIDKIDYARTLNDCHRLLRLGGLLVADNIAFPDADEFNRAIFSDSAGWQPVSLLSFLPGHSPEKDGLCLALRC
jgi:predicted O-methyltransferase YrrM